jgi:hypothetical protein
MIRSLTRLGGAASLAALALFLTTSLPIKAQDLKDPGFETAGPALVSTSDAPNGKAQISGTIADGWQDNTSWGDVKIVYSLDPNNPHGGATCQRIDIQRGFAQFVQPITFKPECYTVSLWVRAEPAQWVALSLRQSGPPYDRFAATPVKIGATWTRVTVKGLTPATGGYAMVNIEHPGTLWLDDGAMSETQTVQLTPPKTPVTRGFFGLNVNHMHDSPGFDWPAIEFGSYRSWDSGVMWPKIEPQRGVYDWTNLDKDVAMAQQRHQAFLFTLGQTPHWASSRPDEHAAYGNGVAAPPADIRDWTDFVTALVTRYKGRINAYEIWNEPDEVGFYTGTPTQLAELGHEAALIIRKVDPKALIVTPPVAQDDVLLSPEFLDGYLSYGGGRDADVIAYHGYNNPPEANIAELQDFARQLALHGVANKPVWITEAGPNLKRYSETEVGNQVARNLILDWALGMHRVYLYAYDNAIYCGFDLDIGGGKRDPSRLSPAGIAYQEVESWLIGSTMVSCKCEAGTIWTSVIRRPDSSLAYIVWNSAEISNFAVPASWNVKHVRTLTDSSRDISGGSVAIGSGPVLLEP